MSEIIEFFGYLHLKTEKFYDKNLIIVKIENLSLKKYLKLLTYLFQIEKNYLRYFRPKS